MDNKIQKENKMTRVHKEEMIRFANSPAGTKVWCKSNANGMWGKLKMPSWDENSSYIVDDEFAELRKQFVDDPTQIEWCRELDEEWEVTLLTDLDIFTNRLFWGYKCRIKPKKVTKWKWVMASRFSGKFRVTELWYTEEEAHSVGNRAVCKIEESAKEFEE
jgi:hypothetical protein